MSAVPDTDLPLRETPDIETSSAEYARRFAGEAGRYLLDVQARAVGAALQSLPAGSALDVGGGHGQLVDSLFGLGWSVTVLGTDEICCRNLREVHGKRSCGFVRGDLHALPFGSRSFDLVAAVRLTSHVANWRGLLSEMCRVARAAVVIDYPSKAALNALTPMLFGLKKSLEGNTRSYRSFSHRELAGELAVHGFEVTREIKQFCLPMVLHRVTRAAAPMRWSEAALRAIGLTRVVGSPVILRADRRWVEVSGD